MQLFSSLSQGDEWRLVFRLLSCTSFAKHTQIVIKFASLDPGIFAAHSSGRGRAGEEDNKMVAQREGGA